MARLPWEPEPGEQGPPLDLAGRNYTPPSELSRTLPRLTFNRNSARPWQTQYPRTSGEGGADRGYSPQTVNVVSAAMKAREDADVPLYPTDYRRGYDEGVAGRTQSVRVPDRSPYPGAPERATGTS